MTSPKQASLIALHGEDAIPNPETYSVRLQKVPEAHEPDGCNWGKGTRMRH